MATAHAKPQDVQRDWWLVDLDGQTVGRAATQIAHILRGKHKPIFSPHSDMGDVVVCINAAGVKFTGRKLDQKEYHRFTGYIGNMKHETARELLARKPEEIIKKAVKGMLPKGPLGRKTFGRFKVYADATHPHAAQALKSLELQA